MAAHSGHTQIAALLLENGANPNSQGSHARTPLHTAMDNAETALAIAQLLIDHGANVDVVDASRRTPLHYAVEFRYPKVEELLRAHGRMLEKEQDRKRQQALPKP
jgi:ankyrin repeat protein